jgi:hypothetical protein
MLGDPGLRQQLQPARHDRARRNRGRRWAEHKALACRLDTRGWVYSADFAKGVAEQLGNLLSLALHAP